MGIPVLSCSLDKWCVGECVCAYMWYYVLVAADMCATVCACVITVCL